MKTVLRIIITILTVLAFIFVIVNFFSSFSLGFMAAMFNLVLGLAALCPMVAVIVLLGDVDALETRVQYLENELIRNDVRENPPISGDVPEARRGSNSIVAWTCQKCGTVNKAGTSNCEHCGAAH
ncbi:MAG: zinc finger Ran-binding domain-containing family 2 protein [Clostridia bacterium]|nr:zinc finger Ran-binding domain-containing family 2 protein [Clostridia bacterium]